MMRALGLIVGIFLVGAVLGGLAIWNFASPSDEAEDPNVLSIAEASLDAVRAQNRLSVFAGRFTVAVTSRTERLGFAAEKTMIVPATVRYEIDYSALTQDDIAWDADTSHMIVTLPDVEISEPEIDLSRVREYGAGTVLRTLGNADDSLDRANRRKVRAAVLEEAQAPIMVDMAREAARDAAARGFRLPLEAAGIPAQVDIRFPGETGTAM